MTYKIAQKIITPENFQANTNLISEYGPIVQLGLQAAPGTQFILNDSGIITMGAYGIYELDLKDGIGKIVSVSLPNQTLIDKVYIDMVYESWEE